MISLNIKSKSYMCLDIERHSIIHRLLVEKLRYLRECIEEDTYGILDRHWGLKWLESFHISLGKPPALPPQERFARCHMDIVPIVGDITLAPICISERGDKKSAWVPLHPQWVGEAFTRQTLDYTLWEDLNLDQFDSYDHRCDDCPVKHLHVSIANLTRNPHDSIARPEDCIIDTISDKW